MGTQDAAEPRNWRMVSYPPQAVQTLGDVAARTRRKRSPSFSFLCPVRQGFIRTDVLTFADEKRWVRRTGTRAGEWKTHQTRPGLSVSAAHENGDRIVDPIQPFHESERFTLSECVYDYIPRRFWWKGIVAGEQWD